MYKNQFVLAVKNNDKILREFKDTVYLPFGSEYSLYLKNLNTVRALAKIWVDGQLVTEDVELIVPPNGHIDLERFIRKGNLEQGNKFKFIERSAAVESFRGTKAEDGLVRVEFKFEQPPPKIRWMPRRYSLIDPGFYDYSYTTSKTISGTIAEISDTFCTNTSDVNLINDGNIPCSADISCNVNDVGITAAGSASDQQFTLGSWFPTEAESHVIILKLLGQTEKAEVVQKPVTVKAVPKCTNCGRKNKATTKFCAECGTALYII